MKINKRIEIVCSTNTRLSSMSLRSRNAVLATLARHYTEVAITIVNNYTDLQRLADRKPDLVFLGMNSVPLDTASGLQDDNRVWISDYLDTRGITCTGSNQFAHELEVNKHMAKQRVLSRGLQTSAFHVAKQGQPLTSDDMTLKYPVFVKPTNRGGGVGIDNYSLARNIDELVTKIQSITDNLQADSLIEEYLPGREFSVAILRNGNDEYMVMPIEIIAEENENGERILAASVKSLDTELRLEITDPDIKSQVSALALGSFHALGARDYGRIDIRLDAQGAPHFLEANLLPSLISGYGSFPISCMINAGLSYESMILHIVDLALIRSTVVHDDLAENTSLANTALAY